MLNLKSINMEATCNHCTHWEQTQNKLNSTSVRTPEQFGVCNELSDAQLQPEYIVPVLNNGKPVREKEGHYEYITGANFGCNHFEEGNSPRF